MDAEETTAERYQRELNERIETRATDMPFTIGGPFEEAYENLATLIVAASNTYVTLRVLEDLIEWSKD